MLLLSVFLLGLAIVHGHQECQHRDFGNGATVCVCNSTHCDALPPLKSLFRGQVQMFTTTRRGDRMRRTLHHFREHTHEQVLRKITLHPEVTYQKIIGFGGAFTDSAGINIANLTEDLQDQLLEDYFGKNGIEYNIGRIPIGGSDFSTRPYTYDDHEGDDKLEKFALQEEDLKYKIPYLKKAQAISGQKMRYFGSPWGAPTWMKTNHEANHGGFIIGKPGDKYFKIWANYFVKFLQEYEKQNVTVWGLTIENEPGAGFNPKWRWNSLGFNATMQRDFLKMDLGPALEQAGFGVEKLKMMIYDDQLPKLKEFTSTLLSDPAAAKYASGIAFHWYHNDRPEANRSDLDTVAKMFPDKFILATEACETWKSHKEMKIKVSLGNWATLNRYAVDIIGDLNHHVSGWVDWNLVLDQTGGPNWSNNFVDAPIIVSPETGEYFKQPFFYGLGHFSKFLPPNSVRLDHHMSIDDNGLFVTVFQRPDNATVAIVLNKHPHIIPVMFDDPRNGQLKVNVPQESIQSLVWYN